MSRYNILSPDNFPISPEPFTSLKKTRAYFEEWKARFKEQGYYSTATRARIQLVDLHMYCELITL